MARRKDHTREELKEIVMDTCLHICEKEGFQALTARRIAGEIGYAPGTIYNLYSSMDELYMAVNLGIMQNLYDVLSNIPQKDNLYEQLCTMAQFYYQFTQDHKNHWLMLFQHQLPGNEEYPDWFASEVSKIFEPLEELLKPIYPDIVKRKMASRGLWASIHGIIFLEATGKIPKVEHDSPSSLDLANFMIAEFLNSKI